MTRLAQYVRVRQRLRICAERGHTSPVPRNRTARPSFPTATRGRKQLYEGSRVPAGLLGDYARHYRRGRLRTNLLGANEHRELVVGSVVRRLDVNGPSHSPERGAAGPGSYGANIGYSWLGHLADRPRLPRRPRACTPGARRVRGPVLPEFRGVRMKAFRGAS